MTIVTFPIGTRSKNVKIGLTAVPVMGDIVRRATKKDLVLTLNTLDSYVKNREKYISPYLNELKKQKVYFDSIYVDSDKETYELLNKQLHTLYEKNFLIAETKQVNICKCGKVEYVEEAFLHQGARLYKINREGKQVICTACNSPCTSSLKKVLLIKFPIDIPIPQVIPANKSKEVKDLMGRIEGMEYLISRTRDTGIRITIENHCYYVDVDFFWLNFLNILESESFILIGSNHVVPLC